MNALLGRLEPKTLHWASHWTLVAVGVGVVSAVAMFGMNKNEQQEFRCYAMLSSQPTRMKAIEDDCYQKYDHQYNKVSLATFITCVSLFEFAVGLMTLVYTIYASGKVNHPSNSEKGLCKAYVAQLFIRAVILLVILCVQWTVMPSISFPVKYSCHPTQPDHGLSHNITGLGANASTSTRTYSCENPNAIPKSASRGVFFVINLLAFLFSVGEMAYLTRYFKAKWPTDEKFCKEYLQGKRDQNEGEGDETSEQKIEKDGGGNEQKIEKDGGGNEQNEDKSEETNEQRKEKDVGGNDDNLRRRKTKTDREDWNMAIPPVATTNVIVKLINEAGEVWTSVDELLHSGSGRHNLSVGTANPGDILLHKEQKRPSYNMFGRVTHVFQHSGNKEITCVVAYDNWDNDTGGDPKIISGGPGHKHVKVEVTSQFARGFNHTVFVYGKK